MKKRLLLSLMTVAMISVLVAGASFALFSANTTNGGNTLTAGTVTLGEPRVVNATLDNIAPGDSGDVIDYTVTYTGNLPAWLGVKVWTSGSLFAGTSPATVTVADGNTNTYVASSSIPTNPTVIKKAAGATTAFNNAETVTFDVNYAFPIGAGNEYQGATGTVNLALYAVQSEHNTNSTNDGPISWN
ncbi:MAG: TasA family protein [Clostridia bacterium]|nr:TasA family protein [Clostridia bacterium]